MMLGRLGLPNEAWTAIATIALVVVTAVYVLLTWGMARAARASAVSAQIAAEATKAAAEIALANLPIDFKIVYTLYLSPPDVARATLTVVCTGSTVYFHRLNLVTSVGAPVVAETPSEMSEQEMERRRKLISAGEAPLTPCPPAPNDFPLRLPYLLHSGERAVMLYPNQAIVPAGSSALVDVAYSFSRIGDVRTIRRQVEFSAEVMGTWEPDKKLRHRGPRATQGKATSRDPGPTADGG